MVLRRRELHPLLLVALLGVASACLATGGIIDGAWLYLLPLLTLLLPLLAGRYVGEERLHALARALRRPRRRPVPLVVPTGRPVVAAVRPGRLMAHALGRRGPPVAFAAL